MKRRSGIVPGLSLGLLLLVFCLSGLACSADRPEMKPDQAPIWQTVDTVEPGPIKVPDLFSVGKNEAMAKLKQAGLVPVLESETTFDFKMSGMHCRVISQSPFPGRRVAAGTRVILTIYIPVGTCM
jgi:hypothetical protein